MNTKPALGVKDASHGEVLILLAVSIHVRKGPWDYTYMAGTHFKPPGPSSPEMNF